MTEITILVRFFVTIHIVSHVDIMGLFCYKFQSKLWERKDNFAVCYIHKFFVLGLRKCRFCSVKWICVE